jgi:oxygen-independent coproporphyrinogen-3 oxidase
MRSELAFYVHIPYCVRRCGYCDFNTYTPSELAISSDLSGVSRSYIDLLIQEIELARATSDATVVPTIFFGGGTPTLMEPVDLGRVITAIGDRFELAPNAEITTEANPDTVTPDKLEQLRAAGINRISFGMQSAATHVLAALDRTHNPDNVRAAVEGARAAGFDEVSVDLIYGAPGESISDWEQTLDSALGLAISHISAYALIVEQGTKLGAQVKRGDVVMPDDDETADKYLLADEKFLAAGFDWYELSNWSKPGSQCRHNMAYWNGDNWWGAGPGAHSHINGRRFWNVKHPNAYKEKMASTGNPMHEQEILDAQAIKSEATMLQIRLREGISTDGLDSTVLTNIQGYVDGGFLDPIARKGGRVVLTRTGRLIADRIVREILF